MPIPTQDFPSNADIDRVAAEHKLYQLYSAEPLYQDKETKRGKCRLKEFFEEDGEKAKILDVALHIAPLIADIGTDFLFGEPFKVEIDEDGKDDLQDKDRRNH